MLPQFVQFTFVKFSLRKAHENETNQYQRKYERIQIQSQNGKQNEQLKATQQQLEQAQDQNQR